MADFQYSGFYLGNFADQDVNENNARSDGWDDLVGNTYGDEDQPAYESIVEITAHDENNDGVVGDDDRNGRYDGDGDNIVVNGDTAALDSSVVLNVTITYEDGTQTPATVVATQTVDGDVYIVPGLSGSANAPLEAGAIESFSINSLVGDNYAGLTADRPDIDLVCFAEGTLIETEHGVRAVERLKIGDMIQTHDSGLQPLLWVGQRNLTERDLSARPELRPIRIKQDALGENQPIRPLLVSPQHRILLRSKIAKRMFAREEILCAAKHLLAMPSIHVSNRARDVTYFHLLLPRHEIIIANGCLVESLYLGRQATVALTRAQRKELRQILGVQGLMQARQNLARSEVGSGPVRSLCRRIQKNKCSLIGY